MDYTLDTGIVIAGTTVQKDVGRVWLVDPNVPQPHQQVNLVEDVTGESEDETILINSHEGLSSGELFGFSVGDAGMQYPLSQGPLAPAYGVSSYNAQTALAARACGALAGSNNNTTNHTGIQNVDLWAAGGRQCGGLFVYSATDFTLLKSVFGEDSRDSVGWSFVSIPNIKGDSAWDFVLSSPRWGLGISPTATEYGRVYIQESK